MKNSRGKGCFGLIERPVCRSFVACRFCVGCVLGFLSVRLFLSCLYVTDCVVSCCGGCFRPSKCLNPWESLFVCFFVLSFVSMRVLNRIVTYAIATAEDDYRDCLTP